MSLLCRTFAELTCPFKGVRVCSCAVGFYTYRIVSAAIETISRLHSQSIGKSLLFFSFPKCLALTRSTVSTRRGESTRRLLPDLWGRVLVFQHFRRHQRWGFADAL